MLDFSAGARQVGRIYMFPDSADPEQFYYLPNNPHVALTEDGQRAIRLLVYKEDMDTVGADEEEAVAFLSLDVDVSFPPEEIEEARRDLRRELNLVRDPRLTPIFFRSGTVRLMLLDAQTPEPGREGEAQPTRFVSTMLGAASPSLYGDNRAIFQAMLPARGAKALMGALDGVTPIGVVYSLTFAGLAPAYRIKVDVDWEKVNTHFSENEQFKFLFYESQVEKAIDELVDNRAIKVVSSIEGVGEEGMKADHDAVMAELRKLILDTFFTATIDRETAAGRGIGDEIANTVGNVIKNVATLGLLGGYAYHRKDVKVSELRSLDIDWQVRRAVERTIYPQAHMSTLLADGEVARDKLVHIVEGGAVDWRTIPVVVAAVTGWKEDGLAAITVEVQYGDRDWSVPLDPAHPRHERRAWLDPDRGAKLRYKYELVFADDAPPGADARLGTDWMEHDGFILSIQPRNLYDIVTVEAQCDRAFPFDRWPAAQVWFRYQALDGSFSHVVDGLVKPDALAFSTTWRAPRDAAGTREVRLRYHAAAGEGVDTGWMPMEGTHVFLRDPRATGPLTIRVVPGGDIKTIQNLLVDFVYRDDEHGIFETGQVAFDPDNLTKAQSVTFRPGDPLRRRYRYQVAMTTKDGGLFVTDWIETEATVLPVGEVYLRTMEIEVGVVGALGRGVESVEVELVYRPAEGDPQTRSLAFSSGPATAAWKVRLADISRRDFEYTVRWRRDDGFDARVGPISTRDTFLAVSGTPPEE